MGFFGLRQVLHFVPLKQCAFLGSLCGYCNMGFLNIMGSRYNTGIAYEKIFNDGRFNSSMWVLPKFVLVYGFIMQVLYVMYIGIVGFLYHDMGVVMRIPSHNIDFKGAMYVLHFGFLFNDECLESYKFS